MKMSRPKRQKLQAHSRREELRWKQSHWRQTPTQFRLSPGKSPPNEALSRRLLVAGDGAPSRTTLHEALEEPGVALFQGPDDGGAIEEAVELLTGCLGDEAAVMAGGEV